MLLPSLLACFVLDPAEGIFVRTEIDPASAGLVTLAGAWEDGAVVGTDATDALVRVGADAATTTLLTPAPLLTWVLPEDALVRHDEDGTYHRSTDRGDTWDALALPSDVEGAACCFVLSDGTLVGTGRQGGPWDFFVSDDAGATWATGTVEGVTGTLAGFVDGQAVVVDGEGAVVRWSLPEGGVDTVPPGVAWQWYDGPLVESPDGLLLLRHAAVHQAYGALPWAWTSDWDPDGSAADVGVIYALALGNATHELLGFGWDGRLRVRTERGVFRTKDSVPTYSTGRADILAGPGCDRWTWPTPFEAPDDNPYTNVTVTNAAEVPLRIVRGNCSGWCEDPDNLVAPGETRTFSTQMGFYLGAISDDGVCHALWQVDATDLSFTTEPVDVPTDEGFSPN